MDGARPEELDHVSNERKMRIRVRQCHSPAPRIAVPPPAPVEHHYHDDHHHLPRPAPDIYEENNHLYQPGFEAAPPHPSVRPPFKVDTVSSQFFPFKYNQYKKHLIRGAPGDQKSVDKIPHFSFCHFCSIFYHFGL